MVTCPNCGNQASEGAIFCDQCGARLPATEPAPAAATVPVPVPASVPASVTEAAAAPAAAPVPGGGSVICPACGAGNVPGEAFCDYCGSPLDAPMPTPAEEPAAAPAPEQAAQPESAVQPVQPAAPAQPEAPAAPAAGLTCPACGAAVEPDEAFCQNCGASLAQPPLPPEPVEEAGPAAEAPAAPVEAPPAPPTPPPSPAGAVVAPTDAGVAAAQKCPACGTEISPEDSFCSSCGFALKAVPAAPSAPAPAAGPVTPPLARGTRLVVSASGAEIPLPAKAEIVVGREDPVSGIYPDVDLTPHGGEDGGVSRRHARIILEGGNMYVVDLDSTNYTFVNKQKVTPGARQQVQSGDEIRFGRVAVVLQS